MRNLPPLIIFLLGSIFIGCHSSTSPDPPPKPVDAVAYTGHLEATGILYHNTYPTWYAYWSVSSDSSHAVLRAGLTNGLQDSLFLVGKFIHYQDTSAHVDTTLFVWQQYFGSDTATIGYPAIVNLTKDSVTVGTHGVDDASIYYLRKIN